ncbi:glycerate kinase [Anaerobacillus sp. MEB173]|uniref:glycerate kinase n=1 Tax=Anaerobacillus sp. MEB173 TaxID=3383345 RepID=UPI003F920204
MKIIIAPDSYKGSLSSIDVGKAMKKGLQKALPNAEFALFPMADGGEGTIDALLFHAKGERVSIKTKGPLGKEQTSTIAISHDKKLAIIESALIIGLPLLHEHERNPLSATSYGLGEAILYCLKQGIEQFIIGLGGSATNDGGAGMLEAVGATFYTDGKQEKSITPDKLAVIDKIDLATLDPRLKKARFTIASDVDNPLCGDNGASAVFGPQKGATAEMVEQLDQTLAHYQQLFSKETRTLSNKPGAGAAGGLGFAFLLLGGQLKPGAELISQYSQIEKELRTADLLLTGEGMTDYQTKFGKAPFYLATLAKKHDLPVIILSGSLGKNYLELSTHINSFFSIIQKPTTLAEAMNDTERLVEEAAFNIGQLIKCKI